MRLASRLLVHSSLQIKLVEVEGGHHVHLYNPEVMDRLVEHFLLTTTVHPDYKELSKL